MSSPTPSNISQHNANMLEEQQQEMQRRHEEEQQLQAYLKEVAEACYVECAAQKVRKVVKAKVRKESEKWRIMKKKKKKQLEYLQQLQDKVLVENVTLLEDTKSSQVMGTKCKEVTLGDKER